MLSDIATRGLDLHVVASISEVDAPLTTGAPTLTVPTSAMTLAPPPAAHHLVSAPIRSRAATTGAPIPRKGPVVSTAAGYLASPTLQRRTTSLKPSRGSLSPSDARRGFLADRLKSPLSSTPVTHHKDEEVIFTHSYQAASSDVQPLIASGSTAAIFPLRIPLNIGKPKSAYTTYQINVAVTVTAKSTKLDAAHGEAMTCDPEDFDSPNLLAGLANDPYFNPDKLPTHRMPHHSRKQSIIQHRITPRVVQKSLPVEPLLNLQIKVNDLGTNKALVCAILDCSIEEGVEYTIANMHADMTHALTNVIDDSPWKEESLKYEEELHILYNATLFDVSPIDADNPVEAPASLQASSVASLGSLDSPHVDRELIITISGQCSMAGMRKQTIESSWFADVAFGPDSKGLLDIVPQYGKKEATAKLPVFFPKVPGPVFPRKIFTVQMFLMNCTDQIWYITVVVPTKTGTVLDAPSSKSQHPSPNVEAPNLNLSEEDFLRRYSSMEKREASLVCLENNVELGPLRPSACETVNLHFVALKGITHNIDHVQLLDRKTGRVIDVRDVLEVQLENSR
ncbi:hypothetical protein PhCBS80983_g01351 [Powellomyces hirtus]|uniref:Trafficking protein particle complex II-specific subunit 65 IgD3 domain-containing protein n=1 Tax=Powellomyces hirtus TaxID=109895 RepID=A0A507EB52_9FUNG|nr:hypothetical protein PhCBS80983_g01351 [Powellomyces hirtus]